MLLCASALVGIFFIVLSVGLYVENRDLAAHGVRTQGEVVWAGAEISDLVFYTVARTMRYLARRSETGCRGGGDSRLRPARPCDLKPRGRFGGVALYLAPPRVGLFFLT